MHNLILFLIAVTLGCEYLATQGWLPEQVQYLPEVIGIAVAAYVVAAGMRTRFRYVRGAYWIVFGALAIVIVCGIATNEVSSGPLFAGTRSYLRAIPLFFLPAVMDIDERKLKQQLSLILAFAVIQLPVAYYQRITTFGHGHISGDWVMGTLLNSAMLSIFLICVACVLTGMFLRKRLSLPWFVLLLMIVLVPTALNETKATVLLLPLGLLASFILGSRPGLRFRNGVLAVTLLSVFGAIFVPVYDYYIKPRWGYGLVEFFTRPGRLEGYLDKGASVGAEKAGRVDAIVVPIQELARDPAHLVFGLGVGNASESALGEQFTGDYFRRFEPFLESSASVLMLETGLLGFALVLTLYAFVFADARAVANADRGLMGALAVGWLGVTVVIMISTFYKEMIAHAGVSFLFWYFSGLVAAQRARLTYRAAAPAAIAPGAPGSRPLTITRSV
jgi:hypothetical protein